MRGAGYALTDTSSKESTSYPQACSVSMEKRRVLNILLTTFMVTNYYTLKYVARDLDGVAADGPRELPQDAFIGEAQEHVADVEEDGLDRHFRIIALAA